jgi:hypothetical protein
MIEILILITFFGLALSCLPGLGLGNPFQPNLVGTEKSLNLKYGH